jgi:hypothetical protein
MTPITYFAGGGNIRPETVLDKSKVNVMLSFYTSRKRPDKRFLDIINNRDSINSLFMDSGAYTLIRKASEYHREHGGDKWAYFKTKEIYEYRDNYIKFIDKYKDAIDYYPNLDVMYNPYLTWDNQQYLEKAGLHPIPVVHVGSPMKWLNRYLDMGIDYTKGYKYIGFGGDIGSGSEYATKWLDNAFNIVCDTYNQLPQVKVHGFGVAGWERVSNYPWHSIDAASWAQHARVGAIDVPPYRNGKFILDGKHRMIFISPKSPARHERGKHYLSMKPDEQEVIRKWCDLFGIQLEGHEDKDRYLCNLLFYSKSKIS